jgi:hypothetical protein
METEELPSVLLILKWAMATLDPCPVDKVEMFLPSFKSQLQVFLRIKDTNPINKTEQLKMVKYPLQKRAIGDYLET